MTDALKPCPFCGTNVHRFVGKICHIKTVKCVKGPFDGSDEEWNTRAADPRIAELEAECERLRNIEKQLTDLNQTQFLELEWLRPIANAAKDLSDNAEEYDFPDGLGQGADQQYWEALDAALEPATDAIDAAIKESER